MKTRIILSLLALTFLCSCAAYMEQVWLREDYQGKKFQKILVLAISNDIKSGTEFENTIVNILEKKGINATNSLNVFPMDIEKEEVSDEQIESKLKEGNYDAVLISYLEDLQTRKINVAGGPSGYNSPTGNYRSYINTGFNFKYTPEGYREEKSYILETRLFDITEPNPEKTMVWSGQSSITDPSSFYAGSRDYAIILVKSLLSSKVIRK